MPLVVVETLSETPLYPEKPTESDFRTLDCIAERNGQWRYSLVSSDRHRMICTFEAPDAESIRESYRRGGTFFSRMWSGDIFIPQFTLSDHDESPLTVLAYTYSEGLTREKWHDMHRHLLGAYLEQGVEWVQAYASRDLTRIICEINAPDTEVVLEIHQRFDIPFDQVWTAKVINLSAFSQP